MLVPQQEPLNLCTRDTFSWAGTCEGIRPLNISTLCRFNVFCWRWSKISSDLFFCLSSPKKTQHALVYQQGMLVYIIFSRNFSLVSALSKVDGVGLTLSEHQGACSQWITVHMCNVFWCHQPSTPHPQMVVELRGSAGIFHLSTKVVSTLAQCSVQL